jgi:hypothetical protein
MTTSSCLHRRGGHPVRAISGALLVFAAIVVAGCSQQGSAEQLNANAPVTIMPSGSAVVVQNRGDVALTEITVTVVPYSSTEFAKTLARMEKGESREVKLSDLASADGAKLNPMFAKPKMVRLAAVDTLGKRYDVEMPWK